MMCNRLFTEVYKSVCSHPIEARVNLTNGQQMLVEFDSSSTVEEVTHMIYIYI